MDPTRDNPLKRFTAFWVAFGIILSFGVALLIFRPLTHRQAETAKGVAAQVRLDIKSSVDREQKEALNQQKLADVLAAQMTKFTEKPSPGAMPAPGSAPASAPSPASDAVPTE